ncbi:MAG: hypothetical protein EBU90_02095 [Proteobacteria bacterium]|nr:hypothetical protein [Pseudomonadota bacterium]NBP13273.1 hypothetical protein [bacterium]
MYIYTYIAHAHMDTPGKQKVYLFCSDIASYIGQNKWDYITPFERLWKKCDSENYNRIVNEIKSEIETASLKQKQLEELRVYLEQQKQTNKISDSEYKKQKGAIEKSLQVQQTTSQTLQDRLTDTVKTQKEKLSAVVSEDIIATIEKDTKTTTSEKRDLIRAAIDTIETSESKRKILKREAESFVNKSHGTLKEATAIQMFEAQFNVLLDVSQKLLFRKLELPNTNSKFEWYIGGKMDGIDTTGGYIVEVKNRTKSFFNSLRDYEKTQIHMYMYLTGYDSAKLVEKCNSKIRVTHIFKDTEYLESCLAALSRFVHIFEHTFLADQSLKRDYLQRSQESKRTELHRLFFTQDTDRTSDVVCMIDDLD